MVVKVTQSGCEYSIMRILREVSDVKKPLSNLARK